MEYYDAEGNPIEVQQRKNTIWNKLGGGPLMFAAIFHLILLIIGAFWIFQIIREPEKKVDFLPPGGGGGERGAEQKVAQKKRAQITPTTNVKRVFAQNAQSTFSIPEQGDDFGQMSTLSSLSGGGLSGGLGGTGNGKGFGKGNGNGAGMGNGMGTGKLFGLIPESMRKRCSKEDRLQRLKDNGGTPACEEAVVKGLRWLKNTQNSDGSWGDDNRAAMTGFALLAYFGHCETPVSDEFGESCMRGIVYLVDLGSKNDGRMASNFTANSWPYEHAIATYALGEASTFCKEGKIEVPQLLEVAQKAGQFIIDNQNKNGGWAYLYATEEGHTDVSVVGWQLQALKACEHAGFRLDRMKVAVNQGLEYIAGCQDDSGGYGYTGKSTEAGYFTLTGVGMLCNQVWDKGARAEVRKAAKYVMENSKFEYNGEFADLYGHYYESQAMMQRGGEDWKFYNNMFRDQLLNNQNEDGSWKVPGGGKKLRAVAPQYQGGGKDGSTYRTCLCTLMLEVYYRFLSTGGGKRPGDRPGI